MNIDRKYKITAVNPCSGNMHTENDSILFLAKDRAVPAMLRAYRAECELIGANPAHIESIALLIERVEEYQRDTESKVPDTDLPCEIARCVSGVGIAAADAEAVPEPICGNQGFAGPSRCVLPQGHKGRHEYGIPTSRPQPADVGVLVETLAMTIEHLSSFVAHAPHGDNCFVSDHYEGDPGSRCNCGKDSAGSAAISGLEAIAEWEAKR